MLRAFAALDTGDRALLRQMHVYLPKQLEPAYQSLVDFLVSRP